MIRRSAPSFAFAALASLAVAACGGGGHGAVPSSGAAPAAHAKATLTLQYTPMLKVAMVPPQHGLTSAATVRALRAAVRRANATRRRPTFLDPEGDSLTITASLSGDGNPSDWYITPLVVAPDPTTGAQTATVNVPSGLVNISAVETCVTACNPSPAPVQSGSAPPSPAPTTSYIVAAGSSQQFLAPNAVPAPASLTMTMVVAGLAVTDDPTYFQDAEIIADTAYPSTLGTAGGPTRYEIGACSSASSENSFFVYPFDAAADNAYGNDNVYYGWFPASPSGATVAGVPSVSILQQIPAVYDPTTPGDYDYPAGSSQVLPSPLGGWIVAFDQESDDVLVQFQTAPDGEGNQFTGWLDLYHGGGC